MLCECCVSVKVIDIFCSIIIKFLKSKSKDVIFFLFPKKFDIYCDSINQLTNTLTATVN